jgi:hypothetical protein
MSVALKTKKYAVFTYALIISLLFGCSAPRYLELNDIKKETSVKIYLSGGNVVEGLITGRSDSEIVFVNERDHQTQTLKINEIRRIEKSTKNFDFRGNLISDAEIGQYKSSRNSWGYAIGGAALGGLFGVLVGLPFWYADAGVPPYFTGGIGAVSGSIFFGLRGIQKDREIAIETVRYLREKEKDLQKEKDEEERKLEELRKKKEELKKKIGKGDGN